jgi:hypothetical protein
LTADPDRDRQLEQALTRELRRDATGAPGERCLDAETLAAWMDGGLDRDAVALLEDHAASCPRCRSMLAAFAETASVAAGVAESRPRLWRWWFAPIAAATAATVLWVIVPSEGPTSAPASPQAEVSQAREEPRAASPSEPARDAQPRVAEPGARTAAPDASAAPEGTAEGRRARAQASADARFADQAAPSERVEKAAPESTEEFQAARQRADAAAAAAQPAPLERAEQAQAQVGAAAASPPALRRAFVNASVEVAAPDSATRWRVTAAAIERSIDAGATWQQVADVDDRVVTAGSAPSRTVCWLVGRGGIVLLTTDARAFTRLPFPEPLDLALVTAKDARVASVTAVDGRVFDTVDGGRTWRLR